jgi:hypothetical protein
MRYLALACDDDGTLAAEGLVAPETLDAYMIAVCTPLGICKGTLYMR